MADPVKFRADHVGSLLRPPALLRARRRHEAGEITGLEQLALSPQCGFASIAEGGNLLTPDEEFAKLKLVADVARATWGPND